VCIFHFQNFAHIISCTLFHLGLHKAFGVKEKISLGNIPTFLYNSFFSFLPEWDVAAHRTSTLFESGTDN
jgi:hypothetical protein